MTAHLYAKDVRAIRRAAEDLLRQCEHYERNSRNGGDDRIRLGLMLDLSMMIARRARRGYRRFHREQGWKWDEWWRL